MKYTNEQIRWLKENYLYFPSYENLTTAFNNTFNARRTANALQQFLSKRLKLYLVTDKTSTHYTDEQRRWLIDSYGEYSTYEELVEAFNIIFNTARSRESIRELCSKRLKLKGMENRGIYQKGKVKEQCRLGTIRKGRNGSVYIKVKNSQHAHISGYAEPYWLPIQKKIWQDHYGEVPEGKMVIFLDGNHENLDIDNLYCIDRRISVIMAKNRWYTDSREHTLTAIKYCELHYALKDQKNIPYTGYRIE